MQGSEFDEAEFFRGIAASGARALLIGRRALVALGIPVLTADVWARRRTLEVAPGAAVAVPTLDDLILTKRFGGRLGEAEEEESRSLIRWFRRRYPTPAERLAYARRAYRRWTASRPTA